MWVLGLNGRPVAYHDASACLVGDGQVVAFAEEERFTRRKHALQTSPVHAAEFCLQAAAIQPEDIDVVAVGWDVPRMRRAFGGLWDSSSAPELIREMLGPGIAGRMRAQLEFVPHHLAHAAAAFWASGFDQAAVIVADGQGEDDSISLYRADCGAGPTLMQSWPLRYSLGFLYEAASEWLTFGFLDAGKTMALASFGQVADIDVPSLLSLNESSSARGRSADARDSETIARFWRDTLSDLAGCSAPAAPPAGLAADRAAIKVAWAAQRTVEQVMTELAALARRASGTDALCLAGGVALNCVANGLIDDPLYVPPVPHDSGVALGAAWTVCPPTRRQPLRPDLGHPIGPLPAGLPAITGITSLPLSMPEVIDRLSAGQIGAIAEGRAESGPRALGRRSIIALPRPADVAGRLNRLKGREPWRPFGPAALGGSSAGWWEQRTHLDRYMVGAVPMTDAGCTVAPAVRHIDGTTRPQVVRRGESSLMQRILTAMEQAGIPPVLVNTSFNRQGQPIINTAEHALETFLVMDLDFLLLDEVLLSKRGHTKGSHTTFRTPPAPQFL